MSAATGAPRKTDLSMSAPQSSCIVEQAKEYPGLRTLISIDDAACRPSRWSAQSHD
jgi:hypothetical protein